MSTNEIRDLLREDLRGRTAYGAPQLDVPVQLNTNENSYPVPQEVVDAIIEATAKVAPISTAIPTASSPSCGARWRTT
ncbi:hypothetical protein GCM10025862_09930 [Arsenicicoccus piscis]|uniref:Histidinol-phosphate transaminase n=1 Tax=Arsenicicoccus piscis TaxID=673954 RepID=A0ABQ6HKV3_9MICO|nr:hypothetical protein GCM10025862_09930 [Arsenicicoccus piscis]